MGVAKRIPKRVRKDDSNFKQRIEPQLPLREWGKWWQSSPGRMKNKLSKSEKRG